MNGSRNDPGARIRQSERAHRKKTVPMKDLLAAAQSYAIKVGIDDETYVRAFLMALNGAAELRETGGAWRFDIDTSTLSLPSVSLLPSPLYAANARILYATAGEVDIGGRATKPSEHRESIAVGSGADLYAGAFVASSMVLTAAHCVHDKGDIHVLVGRTIEHPERVIGVRHVLTHPDYDAATHANDLALLMLDEELNNMQCAQIVASRMIDTATAVRLVSFGNGNAYASVPAGRRRVLHVPVVTASCLSEAERLAFKCHLRSELILGKAALARDGCSNESGSPCYIRVGNRWRLVGITSRPIPGYHMPCGDGTICVRVDEWVKKILRRKE